MEFYGAKLTHADDRIKLNEWIPQQWGVCSLDPFRKAMV
jgi:hypothetical protein